MIKRTTKLFVNNFLKNENLKVLDIGCGYSPNEYANVIADVQDFSSFYQERDFVQILGNELPFKDKEFDFVVTSHVIEHVDDPELFIKEMDKIIPEVEFFKMSEINEAIAHLKSGKARYRIVLEN